MLTLSVLVLAVALLVAAVIYTEAQKLALARRPWAELLQSVQPVRTEGITLAALQHREGGETLLDPREIWPLIGEREGLRRMEANSQLLLVLAMQAKSWNKVESAAVVLKMQRDALALRKAITKIRIHLLADHWGQRVSSDALLVACTYHRMSECLLTLYETSPSRRYEQLSECLWPYTRPNVLAGRSPLIAAR